MDNRENAAVSGVISAIAVTSDGVVTPCEYVTSNGGMALISTEDTVSL